MKKMDVLKALVATRLEEISNSQAVDADQVAHDQGRREAYEIVIAEIEGIWSQPPRSTEMFLRSFVIEQLSLLYYRSNVVETRAVEPLAEKTLDFFEDFALLRSHLIRDDSEETNREEVQEVKAKESAPTAVPTDPSHH